MILSGVSFRTLLDEGLSRDDGRYVRTVGGQFLKDVESGRGKFAIAPGFKVADPVLACHALMSSMSRCADAGPACAAFVTHLRAAPEGSLNLAALGAPPADRLPNGEERAFLERAVMDAVNRLLRGERSLISHHSRTRRLQMLSLQCVLGVFLSAPAI